LDLSTFQRCLVTEIEEFPSQFEKLLYLRDKKSSLTTRCLLKSVWYDTKVSKFDVVSVRGVWDANRSSFVAEMIVTSPDTLVSGTTVVGSLFCARKSVLAEKFRSLDTGDATAVSKRRFES
jgi:DNA replication ATP-dependent helicase Dna2